MLTFGGRAEKLIGLPPSGIAPALGLPAGPSLTAVRAALVVAGAARARGAATARAQEERQGGVAGREGTVDRGIGHGVADVVEVGAARSVELADDLARGVDDGRAAAAFGGAEGVAAIEVAARQGAAGAFVDVDHALGISL
jgi:hypothetical protein